MRTRFYAFTVGVVLCFLSFHSVWGFGDVKKDKAWEVPEKLMGILPSIPADLTPTLPAPRLLREPEYTWGFDNKVYWDGADVNAVLDSLEMRLLFFEVRARYYNTVELDTTELWGFVDGEVYSATFRGLPEGITIEYQVRYFAQNSAGAYEMSYWSRSEWSIQDATPPLLSFVEVVGLQESGGARWVVGPTIQVRVVASDPNGQVMEVVVHEQDAGVGDTLYHTVEPPRDSVDITIPYTMRVQAKEPSTLSVWVIDVAGHPSHHLTKDLFWWPDDETGKSRMVCFPNPFNPERGDVITIKVDAPDADEARIFDPFGSLIRVLRKRDSSDMFFEWDGKSESGKVVSNGGYICVLKGNDRIYCKIAVLR